MKSILLEWLERNKSLAINLTLISIFLECFLLSVVLSRYGSIFKLYCEKLERCRSNYHTTNRTIERIKKYASDRIQVQANEDLMPMIDLLNKNQEGRVAQDRRYVINLVNNMAYGSPAIIAHCISAIDKNIKKE